MRRQRRKRHGKRGRGELAQLVDIMRPQWTTGGVRQHEWPGVAKVLIRVKV